MYIYIWFSIKIMRNISEHTDIKTIKTTADNY